MSKGEEQGGENTEAQITAFPILDDAPESDVYSIVVGGQKIFVEKFADVHLAHFCFTGECDVDISVRQTVGGEGRHIHTYSVRPRRREAPSSSLRNTVRLRLNEPTKLVIQINEYQRLFLFADAPDPEAPAENSSLVLNAKDFVTDNTGSVLQTAQIQEAIGLTRKNGILYFPPGRYLTGSIALRSNMTMYLAPGAVIQGSSDPAHYPADEGDGYWKKEGFIKIRDAQNVKIAGFGTIDGNGAAVRGAGAAPDLLSVLACRDIVVENVVLRHTAAWNAHFANCDRVTVRNVKTVTNRDVLNADGYDAVSSREMLVEDCFAYCSDDAACVKSFGDQEVDKVTFRGNVLLTMKSAMKIGTESHANVSNVTFCDNDIVECDRGMTLAVEDGALYKNIVFSNNVFETPYPNARRRLIDFYAWNRNGGGTMEDIYIKNSVADSKWPRPSTIFPASGTFSGIHFENFILDGKICQSMQDADILVDVLPCCDDRNARVSNVTFIPCGKKGWNLSLTEH